MGLALQQRRLLKSTVLYVVLVSYFCMMALPFVWTFSTSLKTVPTQ